MKQIKKIILFPLNLIKNTLGRVSGGKSDPNQTSIWQSLRSKEVKRKLLFTLAIIVVYRILAAVPLPGVDIELFNQVFGNNPINNFFTVITGGRLDNPSVIAIGVGAYINASIIIQLLTTVIPKLEELSKEGERGRQTLNQYTRLLSVPLALIQSIVIYTILKNIAGTVPQLSGIVANVSTFDVVTMVIALTAGSIVLMWLGELISEYGIGNGVSIIITLGILSSVPSLVVSDFNFIKEDLWLLLRGNFNVLINENFMLIYLVIIGLLVLIVGIVYVTEAVRKLPIQYARRVRGNSGVQSSYLPLKINQAGVIPVIFASALLTFPQIISQLLLGAASADSFLFKVGQFLNDSFLVQGYISTGAIDKADFFYNKLFYFVLIVAFTFFYTFVTFKPSETAENLQKSAGFIPGLRPGKATEKYIGQVLLRLSVVGAVFLAAIAIVPSLTTYIPQGANIALFSGIGGTSLLIVVGVVLDTVRQIKSMNVTKSYDLYK